MRLADVLAELARYRTGRIVCDPRVADLRISGAYHLRDTDQTLRFLAQSQPVAVVYRTRLLGHGGACRRQLGAMPAMPEERGFIRFPVGRFIAGLGPAPP
ncbi:hypothetical protein ACU4GD_17580 [Cupriavidus basilensis]